MSKAVVAWRQSVCLLGLVVAVSASVGCEIEKNSMLAPTGSVVTLASAASLLPANTTQQITVRMASSDGSAVPDGTEVWLTASRGRLDQLKQRTQGGTVTVTYQAPSESGLAEVSATSAEARGSLTLIVTSAPIADLSVSASPTELPPGGGDTEIGVVVRGPEGQGVEGVPVTFESSAGALAAKAATSDGSGNVRVGFTTDENAEVTAVVSGLPVGSVRASVRVTVRVAPPPPAPAPPGSGPSPVLNLPPDPGVPFSLSEVEWLHTNVSNWAVTSVITGVSIGNPPVCIEHTKAGRWPVVEGVEGNPWIFANINGRWYAATYEWLRPGQTCKGVSTGDIGPHTKREPIESWRPRSGELVGLMVSAHARFGQWSVAERSNIVMVRWP